MRNKKDFRNAVFERYNREKRKREQRRKNLSAAACSLCMVFVILLSGSVFLSASFGASLFEDVDASFDLIFDALGNKADEPTPPNDMEAPEENADQTKAESIDSELEGDCSVGSEGIPESGSVNEGVHSEKNTVAETTPVAPDPVETVPETEGTARPRPETTRSPENVSTPETTKSPETVSTPQTTKSPEFTKSPESTKAQTEEPPQTDPIPETTKKPTQTKAPETTKAPEWTKAPESVDYNRPVDPPTAEAGEEEVALWRIVIIGSAAVCLVAACIFVYRAVRKQS